MSMGVGFLIPPSTTWKPYVHPVPQPLPKPKPWQEPDLRWADLAYQGQWSEAIIAFLAVNWRGKHGLWTVVNTLVAESRPTTRSLTREATREALRSMMELVRQRRVMRYKKKWVASLELPT